MPSLSRVILQRSGTSRSARRSATRFSGIICLLIVACVPAIAEDEKAQPQDGHEQRFQQRAAEVQAVEARKALAARVIARGLAVQARRPVLMTISDGDVQVLLELQAAEADPESDRNEPEEGAAPAVRKFQIASASAGQLLYGNGKDEAAARRQLERLLRQKIVDIDQVRALTKTQVEKLKLAGHGDIHRFFEQARAMQARIAAANNVGDDLQELQNRVLVLCQETRPLRETLATGPFGKGSLFKKMADRFQAENRRKSSR